MVYVRYKESHVIEEELLFCSPLKMKLVNTLILNAFDRVPAMSGHINRIVDLMKKKKIN